eukprot:TRINITY_DN7373_c0_g1_i6.p1 TRINITY_DN7373_c0_g1~~TRINITY_DN7373_c0_g1_i6.p1  ORF type:complete len:291 (-),score=46.49 TRINITY_DN7373_c0_g1_i6:21-857(-)
MAPVKFDDIPEPASSVLGDDFHVSGYQFKSKQRTTYQKIEVTAVVDILHSSAQKTKTPAKLTWKIPCPLGISFFNVDKLEMDKAGNVKIEASSDKLCAGLKIKVKSDIVHPSGATVGCTYTGIENTRVQLGAKAVNPQDFSVELTRKVGDAATVGIKCRSSSLTKPDVGMRFVPRRGFVASLLAKEKFSAFTAHVHYRVNSDVQIAGKYQMGGKGSGSFSAGATYVPVAGTTLKAKIQHDKTVNISAKYVLAKGFTLLSGAKLDTQGKHTCGFQLSVA